MSNGSSTATIELRKTPVHKHGGSSPLVEQTSGYETSSSRRGQTLGAPSSSHGGHDEHRDNKDAISSLPAPTTVSHTVERWNQSRSHVFRVLAAFWSLLVMGMNDAAYGAII